MSDILQQIADNLGVGSYPPLNNSYLYAIADYYGVDTTTSKDLMADILDAVGGDPSTSSDYLQDIVLALGGTVTINGNWMEAWLAITAAPAFDPDAQAFITATAITDTTQQNAIDALVIGLKTDLLWTKMLAVYPFVGGTATTCKYNLKNPLDTDAAFRLFFFGGWTFSNNGIQPNGANTYADTFLAPSTYWTLNNGSVSAYSRTNFNESKVLYGSKGPNFSSVVYPIINTTSSSVLHNGLPSVYISPTPTTTAVNLISSRINPNELIVAVNGTAAPYAYTPNTLSPVSIYLSARNNNNASDDLHSSRELAFAHIGTGLTQAECILLYNRIQTFQTTLGRQV
jgi:hypothetical protein